MPRILLTGANGFVAGSVIVQCPAQSELHALSRAPLDYQSPNLRSHTFESISRESLSAIFERVRPEVVLHTAAIANIDYCDAHPEEGRLVNVEFPRILAELCARDDVRMVHCSTDNVFDGARGMYTEEDPPSPVNFYGQTKVDADAIVMGSVQNHVIARIAIVYGLAMIGPGNSFLEKMLPKLRAGERVGVPETEVRTPIDVATLGAALLQLCHNDFTGIVHLANNDRLDRVTFTRRIARHLELDPALIYANDPTDIPNRAPRPLDVSLANARARSVLDTPFHSIEGGLQQVLTLSRAVKGGA